MSTWGEQVDEIYETEVGEIHECGYPENSFACRIRHIQINTGAAKAAND